MFVTLNDDRLIDIKANPRKYIGKVIDLTVFDADFNLASIDAVFTENGLTKEDIICSFYEREIRAVCQQQCIGVVTVTKKDINCKSPLLDALFDEKKFVILLKR